MAIGFIAAGINHFWHPESYLQIMPSYFPIPVVLNYAAGIVEIILGALLLVPVTRKFSAYGIIILLILFIPVHVYMIQMKGCMGGSACIPEWILWVRLFPVQFILIAWAWWVRKST